MLPLAIDLFCGLGGWTDGLLAEGYYVVGFDIERHIYGEDRYPGHLVLQDVLTLHGSQFRDATCLVASPPCQAYSYRAMPWSRAKALPPPDNTLFDACFRIQREACEAAGRHIPLVIENVRGAQPWVGRARWNFGSYYLWGDVPALMPSTIGRRVMKPGIAHGSNGATNFHGQKVPAAAHIRDGHAHTRHLTNPDEHYGLKVPGLNFSDRPTGGVSRGFNVTAAQRFREEQGRKVEQSGSWFGAGNDGNPMRRGNSRTDSRKAASAMIAKIPLRLSRHIAATFLHRNNVCNSLHRGRA